MRRTLAPWYEGTGGPVRRYLHADHQGSVIASADDAGNVVGLAGYDEWGISNSSALTNVGRLGYTGQAWIPELGMWYYKARFYSPTLGRFMQTDPIGYGDGMNWYAYVKSDPINLFDPTGSLGDSCIELDVRAGIPCSNVSSWALDAKGSGSGENSSDEIIVTGDRGIPRGDVTGSSTIPVASLYMPQFDAFGF